MSTTPNPTPNADNANPQQGRARTPPRFAKLRRLAWDWQEIGWLALLAPAAFFVAELANRHEGAGQSPMSWFADLLQLSSAVAFISLLAWVVKRALIGDLEDGEVRSARHQVRENTDRATGSRFLLVLDAAASLGCYAAVVYTWHVFVSA